MSNEDNLKMMREMIGDMDIGDTRAILALMEPLLDKLKSEVEEAVESEGKDAKQFYQAGLLIGRTEGMLEKLKEDL